MTDRSACEVCHSATSRWNTNEIDVVEFIIVELSIIIIVVVGFIVVVVQFIVIVVGCSDVAA